ncbi:MAG: FapA family protein [Oscillospiraceae bacterium]|jgi:uncharacterized protein (DUF342 family)|nr:FapA family protein [Oscillospiraceae bacterium]
MSGNAGREQPVDAKIKVTVARDKLSADIEIQPPQDGGLPPTEEMIRAALGAVKVSFGIDEQQLEKLYTFPAYESAYTIARGIPPENGTDGTIEFHFDVSDGAGVPKEREDGTVDYRDLGLFSNVDAGTVLATITPPTPGKAGMSVLGAEIPAKQGRAVPSPVGKNVYLDESGTSLISKIAGQPSLDSGKVSVSETLLVKGDVGNATGNIDFIGNVKITENVLAGFSVKAGGNIEIGGVVESANLDAGGNISIKGGMRGTGRSEVRCNGSLTAKFLEGCKVVVYGNIRASSLVSCDVVCAHKMDVTSAPGVIMGGKYVVGSDVTAKNIGSVGGAVTELEVGVPAIFIQRGEEVQRELLKINAEAAKLDRLLSLLNEHKAAGRLTGDKLNTYEAALRTREELEFSAEAYRNEYKKIMDEVTVANTGHIRCSGTLYENVRIAIGSLRFVVDDRRQHCNIYSHDNQIQFGAF